MITHCSYTLFHCYLFKAFPPLFYMSFLVVMIHPLVCVEGSIIALSNVSMG